MSFLSIVITIFVFIILGGVFGVYVLLGGKGYYEYIKSKLPWNKRRRFGHKLLFKLNGKLDWSFEKIPKDYKFKVREGKDKNDVEYAYASSIFHYKDSDGLPVYILMEDQPLNLFLKKHNLDEELKLLDKYIKATSIASNPGITTRQATEFKMELKKFIHKISTKLEYIPNATSVVKFLLVFDDMPNVKKKSVFKQLKLYREGLYKLKDAIIEKNHTMLNVFDFYKSTDLAKKIRKLLSMSFDNGVMFANQKKQESNTNVLLVTLVIISLVISAISGFLVFNASRDVKLLSDTVSNINTKTNELNKYVMTPPINDTNIANTNSNPNKVVNNVQ